MSRHGKCKRISISASCVARECRLYPIGKYCFLGPNSNSFVGTIVSNCRGGDPTDAWSLRDTLDGDWVPAFTFSPPSSGTYGPSLAAGSLSTAWCDSQDCKGGNDAIGPFAQTEPSDQENPAALI